MQEACQVISCDGLEFQSKDSELQRSGRSAEERNVEKRECNFKEEW